MKNSAFIKLSTESDNQYIDIYEQYGVSFFKGAYLKLLNMSAVKEYVTNNDRLSHGVQYLLGNNFSRFNEKTTAVEILMEAETQQQFIERYEDFTSKLSSGLFFLKLPSRYRILKLVYSDISVKQEYCNGYATFTLSLKEPNPKDRIIIQ